MIYWDNAATTYPKPKPVRECMSNALIQYGANPGRGGHAMAFHTSEAVYRARQTAATLFGADSPDSVVFTLNCTMALNMVVKGLPLQGGKVLISDIEHNAVLRPLFAQYPLRYEIVFTNPANHEQTVENFRRAITADTRLILCSHASNVWGSVQPIREIGALAKAHHIPFAVDAAQSAGVLPIDMQKDNINFLCVAGHKGLYGPMGTGMLLTSGQYPLSAIFQGGTGSRSADPKQPDMWPDHMESGTPNTVGICALHAGMRWVMGQGIANIGQHEMRLIQTVYRALQRTDGVILYTPYPLYGQSVPVLSFNIAGMASEEVAAQLNEAGIAVRAGLQCAPLAHQKYGTKDCGTVRLAPSRYSTVAESEKIIKIIQQIAKKALQTTKNNGKINKGI